MPDVTISLKVAPGASEVRTPTTWKAYGATPGGFLLNDVARTAVAESSPHNKGVPFKTGALVAAGYGYTASPVLHSTTDSPDNPAEARWGLHVFDERGLWMYAVAGLEAFRLDHTDTTQNAEDIIAFNEGAPSPSTPSDYTVNNLTVLADASVGGDLTVADDASIASDLLVGGNLQVNGSIISNDTLNVNDDMTVSGIVTAAAFVGSGAGLTGIGTGTGGVLNTGSTTVGADTDSDGVGVIDLQTRATTRARVNNDGTFELFKPARLMGYATGSLPSGVEAQIAYDTDRQSPVYHNGSAWRLFTQGVFDVTDYGAVPDGTTDNLSAINDAIDAFNAAGRGRLHFPAGDYLTTGALNAVTADGLITGDGHTDSNSPSIGTYVSRVKCSSATAVLFTVNSKRLTFENLVLLNTAASTPTAGAAIKVTNATNAFHQVDYRNVGIDRFYKLLDIEVANNWTAVNCWFRGAVQYGAHIRNLIVPDTGGWAFIKCSFVSDTFAGIGIFAESCGGAHIFATNILGMAQAVKVTGTTTGILGIIDCNFENLSGIPAELSGWHSVRIIGTEFGMWDAFAAGIESIKLTGLKNAVVEGCVFNAPFGGDRAITVHNCEGVNIGRMHPGDYSRLTAITGTWEPYAEGNDGFLALGFSSGWANVGAGFQPAEVSLEDGWVVVRMNVTGGTLNSLITTLPVGYRPKATRMFTASDNGGHCRVIVGTDGTVTQYQGTSNLHLSAEFAFLP